MTIAEDRMRGIVGVDSLNIEGAVSKLTAAVEHRRAKSWTIEGDAEGIRLTIVAKTTFRLGPEKLTRGHRREGASGPLVPIPIVDAAAAVDAMFEDFGLFAGTAR